MVLITKAVEAVEVVKMELGMAVKAVQESLSSPTHLQLNYSVVELLPNQAVNISILLLLLAN
jgi:hypothetical protein